MQHWLVPIKNTSLAVRTSIPLQMLPTYYSFTVCVFLHIKSNLFITKIPWINPCWHKTTHRFTHQQKKWLYVILSQRCHSICLFVCNLIGPRGQRSHTLSSSFHPSVFTKTQRFFKFFYNTYRDNKWRDKEPIKCSLSNN